VTAGILVWSPLLATGRRPVAGPLAAAAGTAVMLLPPALVTGGTVGGALAAGVATAGFLLLLAGAAALIAVTTRREAAGVALAGLAGAVLVAAFHLGDPLIEWTGPGKGSATALAALHAADPLSGAIGRALGVDWLRLPIMYSGFPGSVGGGLSTAQYYYWTYFPWWGTALLHGGLGLVLLAGAGRIQRIRCARH